MAAVYQELTDRQLIDRLAELTARLATLRGLNTNYEIVKREINVVQAEIEARNLIHKREKGKWWSHMKKDKD